MQLILKFLEPYRLAHFNSLLNDMAYTECYYICRQEHEHCQQVICPNHHSHCTIGLPYVYRATQFYDAIKVRNSVTNIYFKIIAYIA